MVRALTAILGGLLLLPAGAVAQEDEVFVDSYEGAPELHGYTHPDGFVVLDDRDFCAYILGGAFGSGEYINTDILRWELQDDGFTKKAVNKAIRAHAAQPVTNDLLLDACAHNLTQFQHPDVSFAEVMLPDDPEIASIAPRPPDWQAVPVVPASLMRYIEGE